MFLAWLLLAIVVGLFVQFGVAYFKHCVATVLIGTVIAVIPKHVFLVWPAVRWQHILQLQGVDPRLRSAARQAQSREAADIDLHPRCSHRQDECRQDRHRHRCLGEAYCQAAPRPQHSSVGIVHLC